MRISKWGNSLAVRIPKDVVDALKLEAGDRVELHHVGGKRFEISREPTTEELIESIRRMAKPLPKGWKFDREEANAR